MVMLRPQTFQCQSQLYACAWKICHPSIIVLLYLLLLNSWWFDVFSQPFQGFLHLKQMMIQIILSVLARKKPHCMLHCTILMQLDLVLKWRGKNCTAKLIYPNRNGTVWYLQSALILWDLSILGGGGGVLAVDVSLLAYDMLLHLV